MPAAAAPQKPAAGGSSKLKMLGAVVLSAGLLVVAASVIAKTLLAGQGPDPEPLVNLGVLAPLGFEPACLRRFGRFDFFSDGPCFKQAVNKVLGYGVVAGSLTVKLPQIQAIVSARSADGISPLSCYMELAGYILHALWNIVHNGSPFSTYGETVFVSLQSAAVILVMWRYNKTGPLHMLAALAALGATAAAGFMLHRDVVLAASSLIFASARLTQIVANFRAGHVGEATALLTLLMQFGGSAARVSTAIDGLGDQLAVISAILAAGLNGILLLQYFLMRKPKQA